MMHIQALGTSRPMVHQVSKSMGGRPLHEIDDIRADADRPNRAAMLLSTACDLINVSADKQETLDFFLQKWSRRHHLPTDKELKDVASLTEMALGKVAIWYGDKLTLASQPPRPSRAMVPLPQSAQNTDPALTLARDYIIRARNETCSSGKSAGKYRCTWACGYSTDSRDAWERHEEKKQSQKFWMTNLSLPGAASDRKYGRKPDRKPKAGRRTGASTAPGSQNDSSGSYTESSNSKSRPETGAGDGPLLDETGDIVEDPPRYLFNVTSLRLVHAKPGSKSSALKYDPAQLERVVDGDLVPPHNPLEAQMPPLEQSPLLLRDGILLTREMGFEYVWIDMLCSPGTSSGHVETLYKNADLIIVLGRSREAEQRTWHFTCDYEHMTTVQTWAEQAASFHHIEPLGHVRCGLLRQSSIQHYKSPVADCDLRQHLTDPGRFPGLRLHLPDWFMSLAEALAYMHRMHCRHKDVKPANILVSQGKVLLSDFGTSLEFSDGQSQSAGGAFMTPKYCAPEVAVQQDRERSAVMFSLGCVYAEMITVGVGKTLEDLHQAVRFNDGTGETAYHLHIRDTLSWVKYLNGQHWSECQRRILSVTAGMLARKRDRRPTAVEVVGKLCSKRKCDGSLNSHATCHCCLSLAVSAIRVGEQHKPLGNHGFELAAPYLTKKPTLSIFVERFGDIEAFTLSLGFAKMEIRYGLIQFLAWVFARQLSSDRRVRLVADDRQKSLVYLEPHLTEVALRAISDSQSKRALTYGYHKVTPTRSRVNAQSLAPERTLNTVAEGQ
ncbi:hypothetical protein AC579_4824 [Pseudocercospora musae]|uniref:Protein kinase domain-containing protein n=1 Tax=Pseudocercospora musae TaxID=113226 RepID=A0A139II93_9PEZI|nr:hypothetical protein AC579_4824 [Pseudocercospora musae]